MFQNIWPVHEYYIFCMFNTTINIQTLILETYTKQMSFYIKF